MGLVGTLSIIGYSVGAPGVVLAVWTFRLRPSDARNRWLAFMLALVAARMIFGWGIWHGADDIGTVRATAAVSAATFMATAPAYLLFLGTLENAPNGFPRLRAVRVVLISWLLATPALWWLLRDHLWLGFMRHEWGPWYSEEGVAFRAFEGIVSVAALIGLAIAYGAFRRTKPRTLARRQAAAYFLDFGINDAAIFVFAGSFLVVPERVAFRLAEPLWPITTAAFMALLAYGVVVRQMFDLDLRVKTGIARTVVAGAIATAALVGSELVERALDVGQLVPALLIAGAASLALHPLVRFGNTVADRLMPRVQDTPEYRRGRALDVYRAAVETAYSDGVVTTKEKGLLATLASSLQIDPGEVRAIERDMG